MVDVPGGHVALGKSDRSARIGARRVGSAEPTDELTVSVCVRRRLGAPPLPDASGGGIQLTREEFAETYGAAEADLEAVARFGRNYGLAEAERSVPKRTVVLSGTVQSACEAFKVDLGQYETDQEEYRGREGVIYVPAELSEVIEGVFGLDNRRMARRAATAPTPAQATVPLSPREVATLYEISGDATGQTIGLLEFGGGYEVGDIETFFSGQSLPTPRLTWVGVDGATNSPGSDFDSDAEVTLDIDVSGSVALGANIAVYFAPWTEQGWFDVVTTAIHDSFSNPSVLSISWGWPENEAYGALDWTSAVIDAVSVTFAEAAALGITVFAASGDNGACCGFGDGKAHVLYPASDPGVTSCGGTTISNVSGLSFTQMTWHRTGGGVSYIFGIPSWQASAGVPVSANGDGHRGRGVPDVAGNADPASGYTITFDGITEPVGGTSAVAPLYAGLVAVLNATPAGPVGFLNPRLYSLNGSIVVRDIDDGISNACGLGLPGYTSCPGWDACTGLGSINGTALLRALDPCRKIRDELESLSPGDFDTLAEYERAAAYFRQQLKECVKDYG
jgi:subtilase family serine protease